MDASYFEYIDQYCERTAQGLLNEPLNAITNLAFIIAAVVVIKLAAKRQETITTSVGILLFFLVCIAFGSGAFHTFANRWSEIADVAAIALYLHFYTAVFLRYAARWPWRTAWLGIPVFFLANQALAPVWTHLLDFGSAWPSGYMAAWTCLLMMVLYALIKGVTGKLKLLAAAVVFLISIWFRQQDMALCDTYPHGTHFLWHILNAVVLGLTSMAAVNFSQENRIYRRKHLFK